MIDELAESPSLAEANKLLNQGWVLIKSAELQRVDNQGRQITTTITYILGHVKEKGRRSSAVKPRDADAAPSTSQQQVDEESQSAPPRQRSTESALSSDLQIPPPASNKLTKSPSPLPPDKDLRSQPFLRLIFLPLRTYFPYPYSGGRRGT